MSASSGDRRRNMVRLRGVTAGQAPCFRPLYGIGEGKDSTSRGRLGGDAYVTPSPSSPLRKPARFPGPAGYAGGGEFSGRVILHTLFL